VNVLITGGAGFIGSHLSDLLVSRGHQVVALDDLSSGSRRNIAHLEDSALFEFVEGRAEGSLLEELTADADVVFHLAATVGVFNVIDSPLETIENNVETTCDVFRAAKRYGVKVILASTSEVYGKTAAVPFREDADVLLGPTSKSRWSYAASKMIDEFLGLAYWQEAGLPVVVVRLFNTIGPRQVGRYGMVVPRFLGQALRGERITVYGTGEQTRCFTYVSDVVEWLSRLAVTEAAVGQVFNLGNPREISILQLARKVIEVAGADVGIDMIPYERAYVPGFEEMQRRVPCIDKVTAATGYSPRVALDEALHRTRDWLIAEMRDAADAVAGAAQIPA
jgi:UDP-glucose 4-epimerase